MRRSSGYSNDRQLGAGRRRLEPCWRDLFCSYCAGISRQAHERCAKLASRCGRRHLPLIAEGLDLRPAYARCSCDDRNADCLNLRAHRIEPPAGVAILHDARRARQLRLGGARAGR